MDDFRSNYQGYDAGLTIQPGRCLPGGVMVGTNWIQGLIARGFGWHVSVGTLTTGIQGGGAGTIIDLDQPEVLVSVPANYILIPHELRIEVEVPLLAADSEVSEIIMAVDRTQKWDGVGTSTSETALNLRTDITSGAPTTQNSAFTGNMTAEPVLSFDLARKQALGDFQGTAANAMWTQFDLIYQPKYPPLLVGPAMLLCYWGGTVASTGYAQLAFCVVPSSQLANIV